MEKIKLDDKEVENAHRNQHYIYLFKRMASIAWSVEMITPQLAQLYLDTSAGNRRIRKSAVEEYKEKILGWEWNASTDAITFNEEGHLINGHHRLEAVIKADVPVPMVVARNFPTWATFDRGRTRSVADVLHMQGVIDAESAKDRNVTLVRNYIEMAFGMSFVTEAKIGQFLSDNSEVISKVRNISAHGAKRAKGDRVGVHVAILGALLHGVPEDDLESFCRVINTGVCTPEQTAAIAVFKYIDTVKNGSHAVIKWLTLVTEAALQDYLKGVQRSKAYKVEKLKHIYVKE